MKDLEFSLKVTPILPDWAELYREGSAINGVTQFFCIFFVIKKLYKRKFFTIAHHRCAITGLPAPLRKKPSHKNPDLAGTVYLCIDFFLFSILTLWASWIYLDYEKYVLPIFSKILTLNIYPTWIFSDYFATHSRRGLVNDGCNYQTPCSQGCPPKSLVITLLI